MFSLLHLQTYSTLVLLQLVFQSLVREYYKNMCVWDLHNLYMSFELTKED
jgi:hypothetical protein